MWGGFQKLEGPFLQEWSLLGPLPGRVNRLLSIIGFSVVVEKKSASQWLWKRRYIVYHSVSYIFTQHATTFQEALLRPLALILWFCLPHTSCAGAMPLGNKTRKFVSLHLDELLIITWLVLTQKTYCAGVMPSD